jgi:hypothetical protein
VIKPLPKVAVGTTREAVSGEIGGGLKSLESIGKARMAKIAKAAKAKIMGMKEGKRRVTGRGAPQELQKRAPEGFKAPQCGQCITSPL